MVLTRGLSAIGMVMLLVVLFPSDAYAYLDPGSGSMIFQTIVAVFAGLAYGVRLYWGKIRGLFQRQAADVKAVAQSDDAQPPQ